MLRILLICTSTENVPRGARKLVRGEMYDTPFTDRTLSYGPVDASETPRSGPVLGNGVVRMSVDATADYAVPSVPRVTVHERDSFAFVDIVPDGALDVTRRTLSLSAGVWRVEGTVAADESDPGATESVAVDTLPLRHIPECCLQSIETSGRVTFTHTVTQPDSANIEHKYLQVLSVFGTTVAALAVDARTTDGGRIAYCCFYVSSGPSMDHVLGLVAQEGVSGKGAALSKVCTTSGVTRLDLVHVILHGQTVVGADAIAHGLRLFRSDTTMPSSVTRARATHALRWSSLWNGDLTIVERSGATADDLETLKRLNVHVRTCLYSLYANTRDPNVIVSKWGAPPHPAAFDQDGDVDAVTCPALLSVTPWLAWMQPVHQAATAWTPLHVIARTVVDAWNGYRATLDRPRLDLVFQTVRLDVAEVDMRVEMQGEAGSPATVGIARSLRGEDVDGDAYTVGCVRRAFAAAEQICNTLRIPPDPVWGAKRDALAVPRVSQTTHAVAETPAGNTDALILLAPQSLDVYANLTDLGSISEVITDNTPALEGIANASFDADVPEKTFGAIAALVADARRLPEDALAQQRMDQGFDAFMSRASECMDTWWGAATPANRRAAAAVLACVTFGFLGSRFQGHVTRDGYHTVPARLVQSSPVTVLPVQWYVAKYRTSASPGERTERIVQNSRASTD